MLRVGELQVGDLQLHITQANIDATLLEEELSNTIGYLQDLRATLSVAVLFLNRSPYAPQMLAKGVLLVGGAPGEIRVELELVSQFAASPDFPSLAPLLLPDVLSRGKDFFDPFGRGEQHAVRVGDDATEWRADIVACAARVVEAMQQLRLRSFRERGRKTPHAALVEPAAELRGEHDRTIADNGEPAGREPVDGAGEAKLGAPEFPRGVKKKDEFFGEMETYRKEVAIRIPVEGTAAALQLLAADLHPTACEVVAAEAQLGDRCAKGALDFPFQYFFNFAARSAGGFNRQDCGPGASFGQGDRPFSLAQQTGAGHKV